MEKCRTVCFSSMLSIMLVNFIGLFNYQLTVAVTNQTILHALASTMVSSVSDACWLLTLISIPQEPRTNTPLEAQ